MKTQQGTALRPFPSSLTVTTAGRRRGPGCESRSRPSRAGPAPGLRDHRMLAAGRIGVSFLSDSSVVSTWTDTEKLRLGNRECVGSFRLSNSVTS
eukprot:495116-Hanusia_phi.AAC.1